MELSQILWGILVFLYDILKTGREYLVSMIVTTCAVLLAVGPVTGSIAVAIIMVWQLLVCVSRLVKKFVVGLLHVTPNLFTAGFPRVFYDRAGFRAAVWDMILDEPPLVSSLISFGVCITCTLFSKNPSSIARSGRDTLIIRLIYHNL